MAHHAELSKIISVFHYVDTTPESIPLGMENGLILDSQLSASSAKYSYYSSATRGRLNSTNGTLASERYSGWIAADNDHAPWFQVDFLSNVTVTAMVTQGLASGESYVKEFTVDFNSSEGGHQDYIRKNDVGVEASVR